MAYFLKVFCRASSRVPLSEVRDFVRDGVYFDPPPDLISKAVEGADGESWQLEILYDASKRPIVVSNDTSDRLLAIEKEEVLDLENADAVRQRIIEAQQILAIEINRDSLSEDAWVLCDCLQSFIASKFDGLIYAPDDGFYNDKLERLADAS
jgi:hypothetical protein